MTTEPVAVSVETARGQLDSLRQLRAYYRAIDAEAQRQVRARTIRASRNPLAKRGLNACTWGVIGALPGAALGVALDLAAGGTGLLLQPGMDLIGPGMNAFVAAAVVGEVAGIATSWRRTGKKHKKQAKAAADSYEHFLRIGVEATLAMGVFETALDNAANASHDSQAADQLAISSTEAREALKRYVEALHEIEGEVTVPFPWAPLDVDLTVAREWLEDESARLAQGAAAVASDAKAVEAGAQEFAAGELTAVPTRTNSTRPTGDLGALIASTAKLRSELTTSLATLKVVQTFVKLAQHAAGSAQSGANATPTEGLISQTHQQGVIVTNSCLVIEIAARTAAADSVSRALDHLNAAPATVTWRATFESFADGATEVAKRLDAQTDDATLTGAAVSMHKVVSALPQLRMAADTVGTTLNAVVPHLQHLAAS